MKALPSWVARPIYHAAVFLAGEGTLFPCLRAMREMQSWSADELLAYRRRVLDEILRHAATNSPFYEDRIPDLDQDWDAAQVLGSIPLLEKTDLQAEADRLRTGTQVGRVSRKTTGGSTGRPVTVLKDRDATACERAAMWLAYSWYGIEPGDAAARFWGVPFSWKRKVQGRAADLCMNRIRFSAFHFDDDQLGAYWARLRRFGPVYVHGYVSMLEQMARYQLRSGDTGSRLGLKAVIATSEAVTYPQRQVIEEAFGAPVQVEYGCGEVGPIAHECRDGRLHLAAPNLWVEILRPDGSAAEVGESGEIVLTDLRNRAMPLIRYRIGDFGIPGEPCPCGCSFPTLEKVWGRSYDFVEGPDGHRYHGEFFMYVFEDLRSDGVPVGQFQVIQTHSDRLRILVTADSQLSEHGRSSILRKLSRRLPGLSARLEEVRQIPREQSGKMRVIKREVEAD